MEARKVKIDMEHTIDVEDTLPAEPGARQASEMIAEITRYIAGIDELREEMHRDHKTIGETSDRTDAILAEIAELLSNFRAA